MGSLTEVRPKCLVEFNGLPLLRYQLDALAIPEIEEVGIVTGYRRELLKLEGIKEFHNAQWETTQMVESLACAHSWLSTEECIVSYSDIFFQMSAVVDLVNTKSRLCITYDPAWFDKWKLRFDDPLSDAETFRLDGSGSVATIGGKAADISEIEGQYMGLIKVTPEAWLEIEGLRDSLSAQERAGLHVTGLLQMLITEQRIAVDAIPYTGDWGEVDSSGDLRAYQREFPSFSV